MKNTVVSEDLTTLIPLEPANPHQDFTRGQQSFGQIYAMAQDLVAKTSAMESRPEQICLATENKAVIASALLAAICGGPSLLLPPALSRQALTDMQQTTGYTTAITDTPGLLPCNTDVIWPRDTRQSPLVLSCSTDQIILHIFTGGSTGTAKIWPKTAGNLFQEACYQRDTLAITADDYIVATVSPCHIYGLLFAVLVPLVSSASVFAGIPMFPAEITDTITNGNATIFAAVPAHYRVLKTQNIHTGTLRFALSSAGMLDPADNTGFSASNKTMVIEVYGSTETGGIATRNRALGETAFSPFTTVEWTTDQERLLVCSPYISPQTPRDTNNFFRTGDRVEVLPNNTFQLKGRVDGITKVGGKRVDLEQIREAMKKIEGIDDCFVLAQPSQDGRGNQIQALIQPDGQNISTITTRLQERLEPWALPRVIRQTANIPMTKAGKYNFVAIRQLFTQ